MSWSSRRKKAYVSFFLLVSFIVAGVISYFIFYQKPTCSDGKQNGNEAGIDCGGSCPLLCTEQISDPVVLWSRAFRVEDGVYNAVSYIENPNFDAGVEKISYIFKLFDGRNILVAERTGTTYISPNGISPIFEGAIATGQRIPIRTNFSFTKAPQYSTAEDKRTTLSVKDTVLSGTDSSPRIEATLRNNTVQGLSNIEIVAVVFDTDGNAIAASGTFIDFLEERSSQKIVFTWPRAFSSSPSRIEIIPRIPL